MNIVQMALTLIAGLIAWNVSRNVDGPIVHIAITVLVAFLVWKHTAGMGMGGG